MGERGSDRGRGLKRAKNVMEKEQKKTERSREKRRKKDRTGWASRREGGTEKLEARQGGEARGRTTYLSIMYLMLSCMLWSVRSL